MPARFFRGQNEKRQRLNTVRRTERAPTKTCIRREDLPLPTPLGPPEGGRRLPAEPRGPGGLMTDGMFWPACSMTADRCMPPEQAVERSPDAVWTGGGQWRKAPE